MKKDSLTKICKEHADRMYTIALDKLEQEKIKYIKRQKGERKWKL